jgi:hypothetical protein
MRPNWILPSVTEEVGQLIRRIWANLSTNQIAPFPHARMKLLSSKIYIGLINIDFFHIVMHIFLEISRDTTFTTVNLPVSWNGILKGKRYFPVYFDLSL